MKNEIIIRNTLITLISTIIIFVISLYLTSFFNRKTLEKEIMNYSYVAARLVNIAKSDEINQTLYELTLDQEYYRIDLFDQNGLITHSTDTSLVNTFIKDNEMALIDDDGSLYYEDSVLYYLIKVNDEIYLRSSLQTGASENFIYLYIIIIFGVVLVGVILNIVLTTNTSNRITKTFSTIKKRLEDINTDPENKTPIDYNYQYDEVEGIIGEIELVSDKISDNIHKIAIEKDKLNNIIANVDEGILILDHSYQIILINGYCQKLFKSNLKAGDDFFNKYSFDLLKHQINIARSNEMPTAFDYSVDNQIYSVYVSIVLTDTNYNVYVLIRDVTETRLNDLLKANFIANASHELKTPITSIIGFSELLDSDPSKLDDSQKHYFNIIHTQAQKMSSIITELLQLSNFEYQTHNIDLQQVELKDIIDEVIYELQLLTSKYNVKIINNLESDLVILADEKIVYQIFKNLIENALKYNKDNGYVKLDSFVNDNTIKIQINDNGIGINQADLEHIFDRFYRVDKSHNQFKGGSGLGLSIVKTGCDLINAKIEVESTINVGTTFTLTFNKI